MATPNFGEFFALQVNQVFDRINEAKARAIQVADRLEERALERSIEEARARFRNAQLAMDAERLEWDMNFNTQQAQERVRQFNEQMTAERERIDIARIQAETNRRNAEQNAGNNNVGAITTQIATLAKSLSDIREQKAVFKTHLRTLSDTGMLPEAYRDENELPGTLLPLETKLRYLKLFQGSINVLETEEKSLQAQLDSLNKEAGINIQLPAKEEEGPVPAGSEAPFLGQSNPPVIKQGGITSRVFR